MPGPQDIITVHFQYTNNMTRHLASKPQYHFAAQRVLPLPPICKTVNLTRNYYPRFVLHVFSHIRRVLRTHEQWLRVQSCYFQRVQQSTGALQISIPRNNIVNDYPKSDQSAASKDVRIYVLYNQRGFFLSKTLLLTVFTCHCRHVLNSVRPVVQKSSPDNYKHQSSERLAQKFELLQQLLRNIFYRKLP